MITTLEYTKKGNIKRKQNINGKIYRFMNRYPTLNLAKMGMKDIKEFMNNQINDEEWIIVEETRKSLKKPFIVFFEV